MKATKRWLLAWLFGGIAGPALAGPPLSIDDPGILDPGQWEIIVAGAGQWRDSGDFYELPVLDVSYGLSENVQASAVVTRVESRPEGESRRSDFGAAQVAAKWRFVNSGPFQAAVSVLYEFNVRNGAVDRGVVEDTDTWAIPLDVEYAFSAWRIGAELAYAGVRGEEDEWGYGVAAYLPVGERVELLAEIAGATDRDWSDHSYGYRLGADVAVSETFHVLISAGSGLEEDFDGGDELKFDAFLGLQWFLGPPGN